MRALSGSVVVLAGTILFSTTILAETLARSRGVQRPADVCYVFGFALVAAGLFQMFRGQPRRERTKAGRRPSEDV